jgi:hypothetical protein
MRAACRNILPPTLLGLVPILAVVFMFVVAHRSGSMAADFHNEIYPEAKDILAGRNPYPSRNADLSDGTNAVWPPLVAFVVAPLTLLPPGTADYAAAILSLMCFAFALWIVGVRDWRVYGASFLWPPVLGEIRTAHFTLVMCLLVAIAWRTRDRLWAPGLAVGAAVALKFFLWPLVPWLVAIRRYREAALAAALAALSFLLLLPFTSIANYVGVLRNLGDTFDQDSFSPFGLLVQAGAPDAIAKPIGLLLGLAALVLGFRWRSLTLFLGAALLVSPIVWLDFYAVLAIPLAIVRPTFRAIWLLPIATFGMVSAGYGIGDTSNTVRVLAVYGTLFAYIVWVERRRALPGNRPTPRAA